MPALSSRHVSLSDHVKRRKSSVTLNNYGDCRGTGGSCGSSNGSNGSNNSAQRHNAAQHHMLPQHHNMNNNNNHPPISSSSRGGPQYNQHYTEGGYDSHAASYGNYDAPRGRSYGGMSGEHGSYNTENYIRSSSPDRPNRVYIGEGRESGQRRNSDPDEELNDFHNHQQTMPIGVTQPQHNMGYDYRSSNSGSGSRQRRHSSRTPTRQGGIVSNNRQQDHRASDPNLRMSQATTVAMGPQQPILDSYNNSLPPQSQQGSWDEEQSSAMQYSSYPPSKNNCGGGSEYSSYCPSSATVSTAGSSNSSSLSGSGGGSNSIIEEDAIRQGVIDVSMLIATYIAGALSFIIGILLTLFSPLIKIIKLIVGDVRGLLGDAGFIQELGSLWRVYRDLRRRGSSSSDNGPRSPSDYSTHSSRYDSYSRDSRYYDDESTVGEDSTVYTEYSPQYVGGWRPNVSSSTSAGSTMSGTNSANSSGVISQGNNMPSSSRRMTSRSSSSLPLVHEGEPQYHHNLGQAPKSHGAPNMMYQQSSRDASYHQQGPPPNNNNSGYNNSNYQSYQPSSQPQSPQKLPAAARGRSYSSSPVKQSSTSRQHGPSAVGKLNNGYYSPQKNRRQRPGVV